MKASELKISHSVESYDEKTKFITQLKSSPCINIFFCNICSSYASEHQKHGFLPLDISPHLIHCTHHVEEMIFDHLPSPLWDISVACHLQYSNTGGSRLIYSVPFSYFLFISYLPRIFLLFLPWLPCHFHLVITRTTKLFREI